MASTSTQHDATSTTSQAGSEPPLFSDGSNGFNMKYAKNRRQPRHPSVSDIPLHLLFICYWHYVLAVIFSYSREALRLFRKRYPYAPSLSSVCVF